MRWRCAIGSGLRTSGKEGVTSAPRGPSMISCAYLRCSAVHSLDGMGGRRSFVIRSRL